MGGSIRPKLGSGISPWARLADSLRALSRAALTGYGIGVVPGSIPKPRTLMRPIASTLLIRDCTEDAD